MSNTERLVEQYRDYAEALARGVAARLPRHVGLDDLLACAAVGLVEAATRFDPTRGVSFKTFAYYRIRGQIFDTLAKTGALRGPAALGGVVDDAVAEYAEQGAADGPGGAADALERVVARVAVSAAMCDVQDCQPAAPDSSDPQREASAREWHARVAAAMGHLPADEAAIVRMHYFEHASLTECAARLGKHKAWISRLHARALDRMRTDLGGGDGPVGLTRSSPVPQSRATTTQSR